MHVLPYKLYSAEQIRRAEGIVIEEGKISGLQLMCRAGEAAFASLQRRWPEYRQITVFCGVGNNGGDGFVIARLALLAGYQVRLYCSVDRVRLKGDALLACQDFLEAGGGVSGFAKGKPIEGVVVDALLGTGLTRVVNNEFAEIIAAINTANCPVLAVDLPSGLHADTGCVMGCAVRADLTITFIGLKCGLFTGQAADYRGEIECADLDLPETVFAQFVPHAVLINTKPLPVRSRSAHKGNFGHVLLIGGNAGFAGAIRLAGEAALRSGAGLVSIATRPQHSALLNLGRPELMCHGVEDDERITTLLAKASVIVIGPGLGQDDWANSLFAHALQSHKVCVVDADALNLLACNPQHRSNWILTPHPGEAARLLDCTTVEIGFDRFAAVSALQAKFGGVAVLKGAGSLIADGNMIHVATTGNPGMASGGMGDVLAGLMGGLLAQGLSLTDAAQLAVHIHGLAADRHAAEFGERGLLASDLLSKLRELLN